MWLRNFKFVHFLVGNSLLLLVKEKAMLKKAHTLISTTKTNTFDSK